MTGAQPEILTNGGAVWLARTSSEWARFKSREELDEFIENLITARDEAFPQPQEQPVESERVDNPNGD